MFNRSNRSRAAAIVTVAALAVGGVAATIAIAGNAGAMAHKGGAHGTMGGMRGISAMDMQVKDEFGYLTMMIPEALRGPAQ